MPRKRAFAGAWTVFADRASTGRHCQRKQSRLQRTPFFAAFPKNLFSFPIYWRIRNAAFFEGHVAIETFFQRCQINCIRTKSCLFRVHELLGIEKIGIDQAGIKHTNPQMHQLRTAGLTLAWQRRGQHSIQNAVRGIPFQCILQMFGITQAFR